MSTTTRIVAGHAHPSGEPYTALIDANDHVLAIHWGVACPDHTHMHDPQHQLDEPADADDVLGTGWRARTV